MDGFEPYDPEITNPYVDGWQRVEKFDYETHLYLARARTAIRGSRGREAEYIVAADYTCSVTVDGARHQIQVPSGMLTDLASVPRLGRLFIGRVGPHLEAAIVHDFLFLAWQRIAGRGARTRDFDFANAVMQQAMIAADVGFLERNVIFLAVSSFVARGSYDAPNPGTTFVRVPPAAATRVPRAV
ncbi:MAG: DUF1353 domain-containing protein [Pseudomonadota bacterium]